MGILAPICVHQWSLKASLASASVLEVKHFSLVSLALIQCKYEMVVAYDCKQICSWFGPMAMTMRSSAKDLGMPLSARICLAQGARRKESFVMLNGHPCGMLHGWRWGRPKPPAKVL